MPPATVALVRDSNPACDVSWFRTSGSHRQRHSTTRFIGAPDVVPWTVHCRRVHRGCRPVPTGNYLRNGIGRSSQKSFREMICASRSRDGAESFTITSCRGWSLCRLNNCLWYGDDSALQEREKRIRGRVGSSVRDVIGSIPSTRRLGLLHRNCVFLQSGRILVVVGVLQPSIGYHLWQPEWYRPSSVECLSVVSDEWASPVAQPSGRYR